MQASARIAFRIVPVWFVMTDSAVNKTAFEAGMRPARIVLYARIGIPVSLRTPPRLQLWRGDPNCAYRGMSALDGVKASPGQGGSPALRRRSSLPFQLVSARQQFMPELLQLVSLWLPLVGRRHNLTLCPRAGRSLPERRTVTMRPIP